LQHALLAAPNGIDLDRYALLRNLEPHTTAILAAQPGVTATETAQGIVLFADSHWRALERQVLDALAQEHAGTPERLGPDRERLRRLSCPSLERSLFAALLSSLAAQGRLAATGPLIHLPTHQVSLAPADTRLWQESIRPLLAANAFNPPRVRDVARALQLEEEHVRRLLRQMAGMGGVYRIAHDHYFTHEAVEALKEVLRQMSEEHGEVLAAPFRDRIGVGRKVAIQILEFFDGHGISRRFGDARRVFRDSLLASQGRVESSRSSFISAEDVVR
jgi:selenocysteine-specific elongation factor